jgi:hypothetical protein
VHARAASDFQQRSALRHAGQKGADDLDPVGEQVICRPVCVVVVRRDGVEVIDDVAPAPDDLGADPVLVTLSQ